MITLVKKPTTVIAGLLMTFLITLGCIAFTDYGFPYSDDSAAPSPERFWIYVSKSDGNKCVFLIIYVYEFFFVKAYKSSVP